MTIKNLVDVEPEVGSICRDRFGERVKHYEDGWGYTTAGPRFTWLEVGMDYGPMTFESQPVKMISKFYKRNLANEIELVEVLDDRYAQGPYGIMYKSSSGMTEVLTPWSQIVEVWYR